MSSSFISRSTSAMESIRPDDTSGVFSSICRLGLRMSFATWSIICWASGVTRLFLLGFDCQLRVFFEQLLASGGARCLSGCALHNPLGRLEEDGTHRNAHIADNAAAYLALDLVGLLQQLFLLHLGD